MHNTFLKDFYFIYFEREEQGGRKRGRETLMREKHQSGASPAGPGWGRNLQRPACALIGNRTGHLE